MLELVFINLNPCCIQWQKFHVRRGKGLGDTVTQIYRFVRKSWNIVEAHSSISDGNVTTLLHTLINFNPCCIQKYKSYVHRSHAGFRSYQNINCTGFSSKSIMGMSPLHVRKYRNRISGASPVSYRFQWPPPLSSSGWLSLRIDWPPVTVS